MPDPTPDTLHQIPLAEIDPAALTRDREGLDADALDELKTSIAANGLRMPVEVFPLTEPKPPHRYGLISGLRRLMAFQGLLELTGQPKYSTIPAFLRPPGTMAQALASMVEENEIRAPLSPWERGRIAYLAHRQEIFPTIEEAVAKLYPAASRQKRVRLRALAHLAEELAGHLTCARRTSAKARRSASHPPCRRASARSSEPRWRNRAPTTPRPNGRSCCRS
jgi:ParB family chromosome partitioning protein